MQQYLLLFLSPTPRAPGLRLGSPCPEKDEKKETGAGVMEWSLSFMIVEKKSPEVWVNSQMVNPLKGR